MKIQDLALELEGYRVGRPYWGLIDGSGIDEGVCLGSSCGKCGHKGMEYHPFIRDEPRSYRAFAVCPTCSETFEF